MSQFYSPSHAAILVRMGISVRAIWNNYEVDAFMRDHPRAKGISTNDEGLMGLYIACNPEAKNG